MITSDDIGAICTESWCNSRLTNTAVIDTGDIKANTTRYCPILENGALAKTWIMVFLCCFSTVVVYAQDFKRESQSEVHAILKYHMDQGIKYLQETQRLETRPGTYYRGEWPTYMMLSRGYLYMGRKKQAEDSNCFSTASIHNALAAIYLQYPEYAEIRNMLDLSFEKIMTYRNGTAYNFWNLLPPNRSLKPGVALADQPLVRRPTNFPLRSRYINNAANIVEDADDTSLAYAAIAFRKQYDSEGAQDSICLATESVAAIFDTYRDSNRQNRHWFNYFFGNDHNTGAYLTWLAPEYKIKRWNAFKAAVQNLTYFWPSSMCYPYPYKPYLPYGTNDLDGVVNANVLATLAMYNELDATGVESSMAYIEKKAKSKKYDRVGIYYPNRYHFPYAVSKAYRSGIDGLSTSIQHMQEYVVNHQNDDGSWSARRRLNKKDRLQSTAYALGMLVNAGDLTDTSVTAAIERAINYLEKTAQSDDQGIHWEGGVFFSGGTVIRNVLWWKSDAYTTAIILAAFANYRKHLEETFGLR